MGYYIVTRKVSRYQRGINLARKSTAQNLLLLVLLCLLSFGTLLEISFNTTLGSLAVGAQLVIVSLTRLISHSRGHGTAHNALGTVTNAAG